MSSLFRGDGELDWVWGVLFLESSKRVTRPWLPLTWALRKPRPAVKGSVPGADFLDGCPAKVRGTILAVLYCADTTTHRQIEARRG